jgi:hypothetical protein
VSALASGNSPSDHQGGCAESRAGYLRPASMASWARAFTKAFNAGLARAGTAAHFAKFESRCIDRLARNIGDLQDIVRTVQARGVEPRNGAASGRPVVTSSRAPRPTIRSPDQHGGIKDAAAGIHRRARERGGVAGVDAGAAAPAALCRGNQALSLC